MPHIKLRVSSQSGYPDLLYSQEWVKVIFLHLWPQKLYRAFRFGSLWPISCSYPRHSQLTRHSLKLANGRIRQSLTALVLLYQTMLPRYFSILCQLYIMWYIGFNKLVPEAVWPLASFISVVCMAPGCLEICHRIYEMSHVYLDIKIVYLH